MERWRRRSCTIVLMMAATSFYLRPAEPLSSYSGDNDDHDAPDDNEVWHNQFKRLSENVESEEDAMDDLESSRYTSQNEQPAFHVHHDSGAFETETDLRIRQDASSYMDVRETERIRNDHDAVVRDDAKDSLSESGWDEGAMKENGASACHHDTRKEANRDEGAYPKESLVDLESKNEPGDEDMDGVHVDHEYDDDATTVIDYLDATDASPSEVVEIQVGTECDTDEESLQYTEMKEEAISGLHSIDDDVVGHDDDLKETSDAPHVAASEQAGITTDDDGESVATQTSPSNDNDAVSDLLPGEDPPNLSAFQSTLDSDGFEETSRADDSTDTRGTETASSTIDSGDSIDTNEEDDEIDLDMPTYEVHSNETDRIAGDFGGKAADDGSTGTHHESSNNETTVHRLEVFENKKHVGFGDEDVIDFDIIDAEAARSSNADIADIEASFDAEASKDRYLAFDREKGNEPDSKRIAPVYSVKDVIDFDTINNDSIGERATDESGIPHNEADELGGDANATLSPDVASKGASGDSFTAAAQQEGSIAESVQKSENTPAATAAGDDTTTTTNSTEGDRHNEDPGTRISVREDETLDLADDLPEDSPQSAGTWGVRKQSAPTRTILSEYLTPLLDDAVAVEKDTPQNLERSYLREESPDYTLDDVRSEDAEATQETLSVSSDDTDVTQGGSPDGRDQQRSVNSEFVDGLDDLDKFFQSVDPPDELDVGAAGSSIQDVLVGQSAQILIKRVKLGFQFVKRGFAKVKAKLNEYVKRRTTQDGEFALVTREDIRATVEKLKGVSKRTFKVIHDVLEDLFADDDAMDDAFDLDTGLDEVRAKIDSIREQNRATARR